MYFKSKNQYTSTKYQLNPPAIARHERAGFKFQYSKQALAKILREKGYSVLD
jgi:hypothetical protein